MCKQTSCDENVRLSCEVLNNLCFVYFYSEYQLDENGRPLNPMGRTGLRGRGTLGKWGPNHAADAIVSRMVNGTLQFVGISRSDNGK